MMFVVFVFVGDFKFEGVFGICVIMEFQYNSINCGGSSIIEIFRREGVYDFYRYINWYNFCNYDCINRSQIMICVECESGVSYEVVYCDFEDWYNFLNFGGNNSYYCCY